MANATRKEIRLEVQHRLRDLSGTSWHPAELEKIINRGQDLFTKESEYLRAVNIQDIVADQALYDIAPPVGFTLGRVLSVQLWDGTRDSEPFSEWTRERLEANDSDYRNRSTSRPYAFVRNFNPTTGAAGDAAANDTLWLYPVPDTAYTAGLRVPYVQVTKDQLIADTTQMALPDMIALEALIEYTVATALSRGPRYGKLKTDPTKRIAEGRGYFKEAVEAAAREAQVGYGKTRGRTRTRWR